MSAKLSLLGPCISFGQWWFGELAALLPAALRRVVTGQKPDLILEPRNGRIFFHSCHGGKVEGLGDCDVEAEDLPDALALKFKKARARTGQTILALPRELVTIQDDELPLAAAENLTDVVGFEMDRLTPFRQDEVYFHARVSGRDDEQQKLTVALTASPRARVDRLLERARRWGFAVDRVDVAAGAVSPGKSSVLKGINLLPTSASGATELIGRTVTVGLLVAIVVLGGLAISVPLDRKERFAEALSQEVLLARKKLAAVRNLTDEIQALEASNRYVADVRESTPLVSRILDDVTRLLPDDTWLSQLRLVENRLEVTGYSRDAAQLIGIFDESTRFAEPKFRSPVTRDQRSGVERFSLTLKLAERSS